MKINTNIIKNNLSWSKILLLFFRLISSISCTQMQETAISKKIIGHGTTKSLKVIPTEDGWVQQPFGQST